MKYQVHYDAENKIWWIGYVVRDKKTKQGLFVQQIGKDYFRLSDAQRKANKLNEEDEDE